MNYRSNWRVPKPSQKLLGQTLRTVVYALPDSCLDLKQANQLEFTNPEGKIFRYDLERIETILAFGQVKIDSYLIPQLLASGVPIAFFDRQGKHLGRLEPSTSERANLLQAQVNITHEKRLHLARQMAWGIARRARVFLRRSARKNQFAVEFERASAELKQIADNVFRQELEEVIGAIGKSFQVYYAVFPLLLPSKWEFSGRKGKDPLNRMLDFVYAMLEESAKSAIAAAGLNPSLGIWHTNRRHQPLVRDLVAEFKCFGADAVVVRSIARLRITLKDFDDWELGERKLPQRVTDILIDEYQKKMGEEFQYPYLGFRCSYQEAISLQASQIAWYISGQIDDYFSLTLK